MAPSNVLAPIVWTNRRNYSPDDAAIRTILGEAGNQGQAGMQAVGNVIVNRQKKGGFGASIYDILAPRQFNGFDSKTPVGSARWNEAKAAWERAKAGQDITGGALYFANPEASSAAWARNLSTANALKIGDHFFTNNADGKPFNPGEVVADLTGHTSTAPDAAQPAAWYDIPAAIDNAIATFEAGSKNLFVRGAAIMVGLLVIAAGLWFLANRASGGDLQKMVPA